MPGGRAGTPRESCDRTTREQESQEDKEQDWIDSLYYGEAIQHLGNAGYLS